MVDGRDDELDGKTGRMYRVNEYEGQTGRKEGNDELNG